MAKKKPIVSPLGQWAYPGEVTIIPSSNITMKGVNYPVLGVDDLGNSQMMMPGQDYNFPGQYVTEYPQMQFGGMSKRKIDKILNQNKDLNFVQRMYQSNTPSIMIPGQQRPSTHFMESADGRVYPTVVQMPDGSLQYLGDNAYDYANQTGQYIEFPNDRQARRFAKSYKKGTGVLQEFGKGGLRQWFAEEWTDVKTGKPCGRSGDEKGSRPYPACRPKKRVNETTPKTTSEMSSAEKAKFKREKTSGKRIDYNHKRREDGGETWLDQYQDGGSEQNPERMQGIDIKRKKKKVSDSPEYQYDDQGNLLYTFPLRNYANRKEIGSSYIPIKTLNPTLEEFINVASPYYPIDNKLVTDPKINLQPSNYQQSLEEEYVLPQSVDKSFGNLPIVKDDGYSPNRRWVSNLRAKDTGAYYGKDGYAYVLKTNTDYLPDTDKKFKIQDKLSLNDERFENNLEKITSPQSHLDPFKINSNFSNNKKLAISPESGNGFYNLKNRNRYTYERDFPDRIWKTAEQMRVEMRNNPEIMSWANLHNIDLGYKEPGKGDDFFAPKIPESIYANRLVEAGLPVNRPDYSYKPMETYIVQDPSKFNLAGYFPMNSIMRNAEQKVLNKSGKEKLDYNNDAEHFEKEAYIKDEMARRMGINPSAFDSGEYLVHYNKTPITEYTPGKKYGGWLEEYQNAGEVPFDVERMQGVDIRKKRSWLDKLKGVVHRGERAIGLDPYNERSDDFFEQLARRINTATGGKDWYKQPNDASGAGGLPTAMMETVMAPFSIPQLAATYGVTGKVQTPSQAMDIQNPVGAFLTDAVLDPTNLVGAGIAKNLGSGALRNMIRNRSRGTRPDFTPNVSNQLPDPPSELILNPNTGQFDPYYDSSRPYFDEWVRMMNNNATDLDVSNLFANNPIDVASSIDLRKLKKSKNLSGLTKDDVLKNASPKDKEILSKMSESEFEQTVLKPTGEIAVYEPAINLGLGFNTNTRNLTLRDSIPMGADEYTDIFNSRLDRLNEIIAKNNKSGLEYSVKGLSPSGALTFNTPAQIEKLAPNTKVLNELKSRGLIDSKGNVDPIAQDYIDRWGIAGNRNISQGESTWMLDINPGQWRGEVEDIANAEYFKAIPGLNMRNTTASVFSDALPRRGTGTYNSINQYLKELDLGRVKPGFNSQSQSSSGLWQDAIKKGKAFGYFNNPTTVYGSMRTFAPLGIGAAAASQLPEQKHGGWLNKYK